MTIRVLSVFGTRPEAIKMAPVVRALDSHAGVHSGVCVTAQHREMLDQVLSLFGIIPDYDLGVMQPSQDLFEVTARVLLGMRDVLRKERPDLVLVQGDTTTCMAAGIAAFYEKIPVGHVEAGLRSGRLDAPFPEEANRSIVSRLARLHFAPTGKARDNLLAEGIVPEAIAVTGNTVIDALMMTRERLKDYPNSRWVERLGADLLSVLSNSHRKFVLVTGHRRENFGQGIRDVCGAIGDLARAHGDWLFVYPVHPNPEIQRPVRSLLGNLMNVHLIEPLDYLSFVWLMNQAHLLLTDSGGIQEEAPALGIPVLVTRDVTERTEALEAGTIRLVGTSRAHIRNEVERVLADPLIYQAMSTAKNPYGDGKAAARIAEMVLNLDAA